MERLLETSAETTRQGTSGQAAALELGVPTPDGRAFGLTLADDEAESRGLPEIGSARRRTQSA